MPSTESRPAVLPVDLDGIPAELRERPQWIVWRHVQRGVDWSKLLFQTSGAPAKANDPATWTSFERAADRYRRGGYDGVGYVLSDDDPFVAIDIDGCRDPQSGEIADWGLAVLDRLDSYSEVSPSATGARVFLRGTWPLPSGKNRRLDDVPTVCDRQPGIEGYGWGRFLTVTGRAIEGPSESIESRQNELNQLAERYWPTPPAPQRQPGRNGHHHPDKLIERARRYAERMEPAVSGQRGHDQTFHVACRILQGFDLNPSDTFDALAEWNERCEPPWSEADLRRKCDEADKQPGERGYLLNTPLPNAEPHRLNGHHRQAPAEPEPVDPSRRFDTLTSAELDAHTESVDYLIPKLLVRGQPGGIFGPKKSLKTNILIDLALSLSAAEPFLDHFEIPEAVRVGILSGESGQSTIAETARRIARSKGRNLSAYGNVTWGFNLPKLADPADLTALASLVTQHELQVLCVDPIYLAMDIGDGAGNLFTVGKMLQPLTELTAETGATVLLIHHLRKNNADPFQPPELESIAWSGFQEFMRQWLLIGRREKYDPESGGEHRLWLNVGGSAGHSSLWAVDVMEGTIDAPEGRRWDVSVSCPSEARSEAERAARAAKEQREQSQRDMDRQKILSVMRRFPSGETKTTIRETSGVRGPRFGPIFGDLLAEHTIETCEVTKGNARKYEGYRLTRTQQDAAGQTTASD